MERGIVFIAGGRFRIDAPDEAGSLELLMEESAGCQGRRIN
jgi:hypothetical protein